MPGPFSVVLRPNSNIALEWDTPFFDRINDDVLAPTVPTGGANRCVAADKGDNGAVGHWGAENVPAVAGGIVDTVRMFVFEELSGGELTNYQAAASGVLLPAKASEDGTSGSWKYFDWAVGLDMSSGISANELKIEATSLGNGDEAAVWAAYLQLFYKVVRGSRAAMLMML